ncbi:LacI family DNA-binding transcriptional regulator [Mucilaginibacter sp.]|uniref:LacI family DNA-binding transcriptional regulator n=1 Tax=Mucilaginibacter sp. TaxID=1882438 RepID=UPI0025FD6E62|nr:LacI family DNA-binding transcriptional regulator [Mucilaginibacter sp.]
MAETGKEITIYDIAQKLNISAATVSRGLKDHPGINKNTKKKILATAEQMGYRSNSFASNLRKKNSNIIGVIVPRLNSNFMSDVIAGIEKVVNKAGYTLFISQSFESMQHEVSNAKAMFNNRVDGVLVSLAYDTTNISHFEQFSRRDIPVVFFDRVIEHEKYPAICIDNYKAAYTLVSHLIEQGCKKVVHISGDQRRNVYADRTRGYLQALKDNKLPFEAELLIVNDLSQAAAIQAAEKILKMQPLPDAVFAASDFCAINCMLEIKKAGLKIPGDIAFAGFNNDQMACVVEPQLTTIDYKGFEMGEFAARMIINHLENPGELQNTHSLVLRSELIIRKSSLKAGVK